MSIAFHKRLKVITSSRNWASLRKSKCFFGRFFHNVFPSSENLVKRKIDSNCQLCGCSFETSFHVLFQCSFARETWKKLGFWEYIKSVSTGDIQEMLIHLFSSLSQPQFEYFSVLLWGIWGELNHVFHGEKRREVSQSADFGSGLLDEFHSA